MSANEQILAEEFRAVYDKLREGVDELKQLVRSLPRHMQDRAKAYWLAQLETSLDDEHGYVTDKHADNLLKIVEWAESNVPEDDDEPAEDDIITKDHKEFYQNGKMVLSVPEDADHCAALAIWMKDNGIFPTVWFESDHGNHHVIEMDGYLD